MTMPQADGQLAPAAVRAPGAAPWEYLDRRQMLDLALPGIAIGLLCGIITGGALAAGGLALDVAFFAGVTLALPLALAGGCFELLLARGRFPLSALTPVVLFWAVAFPITRILHAAILDLYAGESVAVTNGWLDFIVYQVLLSVAFGIGYWWLHENFAPRWWYHLRDRNPVAAQYMGVLIEHVVETEERNRRRKQRRRKPRRESGG
jgi:hypothetical protein